MIKKWALKKSFSAQDIAKQMKATMRDRKIWIRAVRSQKIQTCSYQVTCCSLQSRKCSNHSNKNKQNQSYSIFEQDMSIWNRIFCLSMQLNKKNHSTCNNTLFLFHKSKTSDSKFMNWSNKHQKFYQQLKRNLQID